ncbi:sarcosine oxidase subunit gamma [Aestuariicoccus sp. MJ-SS9]|uniref:sarcosine oxidase subunit gamma n=1 Tax=Aestuariicoccus sp. MJ-SS9 TaxID=3079855 RepID=UPI0029083351|nr:sarcosine oxidase subunit gamma [Aestuariicoccus sp. MJ-SS9]MDU8911221.1 sarcosine oxidase subunit gamma [Aestuariicoccus sp. MJ-SS9]
MAELQALTPCAGLLPVTRGAVSLSEVDVGAITSVAPFRGREAALSAALEAAHGMAFPAPNRATGRAGARAVWFGAGQAMLLGPAPEAALAEHAALTDQSDGWAVVRIEGAGVEAVLARLVPVDLRGGVFRRGHTARTMLGHMNVSITRVGAEAFQIMAFRSMARTLVHDLTTAMAQVAARGEAG